MIVDFDDFYEQKAFNMLKKLKEVNPFFKVTLFSIPGKNTPEFFDEVSNEDWIELALHGWLHTYLECKNWKVKDVVDYIDKINHKYSLVFVNGFKPPYWAMSREAIDTFLEFGYWLSLHPESEDYKELLAVGKPIYRFTKETQHGHIEWGNNSLYNNFDYWVRLIKDVINFKFISEVIE